MPKFILYHGSIEGTKWLASIDSFTKGYVEAMFFTDTGDRDDAEDGLEEAGVDELSPKAREDIVKECAAFQEVAAELLEQAYALYYPDDYCESMEAAGRDFWYTRNGHGVGFWDRSQLEEGGLGDALTKLCRPFAERAIYRGGVGLIYYC